MANFYFHNHQRKSDALITALIAYGWKQKPTHNGADVIFSDQDIKAGSKDLENAYRRGKKVMMIPHAAMPNIFGDLPDDEHFKHATCQFVPAPGYVDVMRAWGYNLPIEVTGWYLCEIKPFQPRAEIRNVLFAPIHPNADGMLSHLQIDINKTAYEKLLRLSEQGHINLTVRHLQSLENNGLWNVEGVKYIAAKPDQSTKDIDAADLVVTKQTMLYLTVARGVPAVGMGEDMAPPTGSLARGNFKQVKSWEKYRAIMSFPLDILTCDDTMNLFRRAGESDADIAGWRERMIGLPFDPVRFVAMVNKY